MTLWYRDFIKKFKYNPWAHHCVHKRQKLNPILRQFNLIHILDSYCKIHFNISFHPLLGFTFDLFD